MQKCISLGSMPQLDRNRRCKTVNPVSDTAAQGLPCTHDATQKAGPLRRV
jgi:hypothetical protein